MFLFGGLFELFLKTFALFLQLAVTGLQFALAFLELVFKLALLVEQIVLTLKEDFLLLGLRFLAGFFDYAGSQLGGVADTLGIEMFVEIEADAPADADRREDAQGGKKFHKSPPFIVSGSSPFTRCDTAERRPRPGLGRTFCWEGGQRDPHTVENTDPSAAGSQRRTPEMTPKRRVQIPVQNLVSQGGTVDRSSDFPTRRACTPICRLIPIQYACEVSTNIGITHAPGNIP